MVTSHPFSPDSPTANVEDTERSVEGEDNRISPRTE
jgi:hypothetical protein